MAEIVDKAIAEAREWLGTPYHHQASVKGAGTDCLGLLRGIWRHLYGAEPQLVPTYTADWAETGTTDVLIEAAWRHLTPSPTLAPKRGDVLVFRLQSEAIAKHLGVVSRDGDEPYFIHAYSGHGVVESPLSRPWARRIAARFVFPERI
ncbi:NlpC/P60 family protein [Algirhabdus cladophorae]|uniref:NlpC/P60 family protein n=1 Tax=Algirhabdus cladophorae TaxID=3377108 RepID=UPI003B8470A1